LFYAAAEKKENDAVRLRVICNSKAHASSTSSKFPVTVHWCEMSLSWPDHAVRSISISYLTDEQVANYSSTKRGLYAKTDSVVAPGIANGRVHLHCQFDLVDVVRFSCRSSKPTFLSEIADRTWNRINILIASYICSDWGFVIDILQCI